MAFVEQLGDDGWWYVQLAAIWHWLYNQHVLALCALLTGVILKGQTLRKFVSDVCVCMFYVCEVIGFAD